MTDNAKVYRIGAQWSAACTELGIGRRFTGPTPDDQTPSTTASNNLMSHYT